MGVNAEFLQEFVLKESNPNFEVLDSRDGHRRFIAAKCSRLPDDQDLVGGRYGMDFHRARPKLEEALQYGSELPYTLESTKWLANTAFAATTGEEYNRKSSAWENFYSYIWDSRPQTLWVAPHSGSITRIPDDILPYPNNEMDAFTAGVAASCAFNDRGKATGRVMISIHGFGCLAAILDLGGFGMIGEESLAAVATKVENKYHARAQNLAGDYKRDCFFRGTRWLEHIKNRRGTLDPDELDSTSTTARHRVALIVKGLELYGQEITAFTLEEFKEAMNSADKMEVPVISANHLYSARQVGKLLGLSEKIRKGLLDSALQVECSKLYLAKDPDLLASIILDIQNELFD